MASHENCSKCKGRGWFYMCHEYPYCDFIENANPSLCPYGVFEGIPDKEARVKVNWDEVNKGNVCPIVRGSKIACEAVSQLKETPHE